MNRFFVTGILVLIDCCCLFAQKTETRIIAWIQDKRKPVAIHNADKDNETILSVASMTTFTLKKKINALFKDYFVPGYNVLIYSIFYRPDKEWFAKNKGYYYI